jgi:hypothetical protein
MLGNLILIYIYIFFNTRFGKMVSIPNTIKSRDEVKEIFYFSLNQPSIGVIRENVTNDFYQTKKKQIYLYAFFFNTKIMKFNTDNQPW